jgi:hypothetical protein
MKKWVFVAAFALMANSVLFSQYRDEPYFYESWLGIGANFGNYLQKDDDRLGNFYTGAFGMNLSGYGFRNYQNIGTFYNIGFLYPVTDNIESNYISTVRADILIGPGFRHNISEKLKLHYGIGFNLSISNFLDEESIDIKTYDRRTGFGIGGDVGIKYDITDKIYLDFGTALHCNFVNYRYVYSTEDKWTNRRQEYSNWINNSLTVGMRPYIAIGMNLYQRVERTRTQFGKP